MFLNLYKYTTIPFIGIDGEDYVALGCKCQTREEWSRNFWNNTEEFPDNGSEKTELRKFALTTGFAWLDMIHKLEDKSI